MMFGCLVASVLLGLGDSKDSKGGFETIRLHSGHSVRGEILKEKNEVIVVDLGVEVISIPKKDIAERTKSDKVSAAVAGTRQQRYGESGDLWASADLPVAPVKELVNQFGEGVVLVKTPGGLGSGFIVDEEGHCITNHHVVEGETRITVDIFQQSGGSIQERTISNVEIVALSPFFDLALLKIPQQPNMKFKRVYFGNYDETRPGEQVFAVGNPLGLTRSVTQGIISNRSRNVKGQLYLQTSAQINPGNSGGPLFNMKGQVVGVTNMGITGGEGLGFAIPVDYVKDFIRNREAYAYNKDNPNEGYRYLDPPRRKNPNRPSLDSITR